jgi:ATP/maltotriose-dependent transcriptional regulator MalT
MLAEHDPEQPPTGSRAARGEFEALIALAHAAAGDPRVALAAVERATALTRTIEVRYYTGFARLIVKLRARESERDTAAARDLFRAARAAEFVDAFVVAYRAWPRLLTLVGQDKSCREAFRQLLVHAHDRELVAQSGELDDLPPLASLTSREREVLEHIAEARSNAEIARALGISTNTTKVHVHHLLEKLGAKTRMEAVTNARRLGELFRDGA